MCIRDSGNLITLADFYEVSIEYLFCRTENREQINTPLSEQMCIRDSLRILHNKIFPLTVLADNSADSCPIFSSKGFEHTVSHYIEMCIRDR